MKNQWYFEHLKALEAQDVLIENFQKYSYLDLWNKINEFSLELSKEIPTGKVVFLESDYHFSSIGLFFAMVKNNYIIVPIAAINDSLDSKLEESYVEYRVSFKDEKINIARWGGSNKTHSIITDIQKSNSAGLVLFSSGTTGKPKVMVHDFSNFLNSYAAKTKMKKMNILIFLLFDHIGGINSLINCLVTGMCGVIPKTRTPEYIGELIQQTNVNILPASPTFLNLLLISEIQIKYDLTSLRMITYGTEQMPEGLLNKLKQAFPRVKFLQTFGTSETGIVQSSSLSSSSSYFRIDDPNTEYKIVDSELWLKSKTRILGYLNENMEKFTDDGWFKTGDLVEVIDNNYFKIIGRNKEMINVGGEKVLPLEIETLLFNMPEILDCVVLGEKNPIMGQMVVAKVKLNIDLKTSEAKKLITKFCEGKLERYKIPAKIVLMDEVEYTDRFKKKRL